MPPLRRRQKTNDKNIVVQFARDKDFYHKLAVKYAMQKDYAGALKYIEMAIERDPYNADYLFNKACILVELSRTRESIKLLNYIIWNIDPTFTDCYFGLGCNYFEMGDFEKSLGYFEKYVLMENEGDFYEDAYEIIFYMRLPGDPEALDFNSRMDICAKAQKRCRDSSMKFHATGSMYLRRGNYKEAIRQFERSIKVYPETANSRVRLSMAYYMNGQLPLAKLLANSVLKMQKGNHMAKLCMALYYSIDGQADMSEKILTWFTRVRAKKSKCQLESEDSVFYERMLNVAPVGDELKNRLIGAAQKLTAPGQTV